MAATRKMADEDYTRDREHAAVALWAELTRLTEAVRSSLETHLGDATGLLLEEAEFLALLARAPEQRLRMADVSKALGLSKSGVTRLVDRLADRGLVVRAACPNDRRVVYAGLTEDGRRAATAAGPAVASGLAESLASRDSPADLEDLTESLRRLAPAPAADG